MENIDRKVASKDGWTVGIFKESVRIMRVGDLGDGRYVVEFTIDEIGILDRMSWDTSYSRCELLEGIINDRFNKLVNPIEEGED